MIFGFRMVSFCHMLAWFAFCIKRRIQFFADFFAKSEFHFCESIERKRERERGIEEKCQKFVLELQFFFKKRFCAFSSSSSPNLFNIFWLEMRSSTLDFLTNALLIFWTETVRHCAKIWMANFGAKKTFPSKIYYSMPFPSYSYPVSSLFLTSFKIKELLFNWNWFMNWLCKRMK